MGIELVLGASYITRLQATQENERGYFIVQKRNNILVATSMISGIPGEKLISLDELQHALLRSLPDNSGFIPFIRNPDRETQHADALSLAIAEHQIGTDRFAGYGIINGKTDFYRIERTQFGTARHELPIKQQDAEL